MNCSEVCERLLAAEAPSSPPQEVQEHLQTCRECRRLQHRLSRLNQALEALPLPPDFPQAKTRFVEGWRRDAAHPGSLLCPPAGHGLSLALLLSLAVAALLVGAGLCWLFLSAWGPGSPDR